MLLLELVIVQQEVDGTYKYQIKELDVVSVAGSIDGVVDGVEYELGAQRPDKDNQRLLAIKTELSGLRAKIDNLTTEAEALRAKTPDIKAMELLEEMPKFRRVLRLFEIDHPLEIEVWGDILSIGILVKRDKTGDGDLDIDVVLHPRRVI